MNYRLGLFLAWALATSLSVLVAFAAVASVRTVIAAPGSFLLPEPAGTSALPVETAPLDSTAAKSDEQFVTTSSAKPTSSTTTSTSAASSSSVTASSSGSTPSTTGSTATTAVSASPTTTSPQPESNQGSNTYEVEGGWVTLSNDSDGVYLDSASPKSGWTVEVEEQGPEEVVVVFKAHEAEVHFVAKFNNGQVTIKIED